MSATDAESFEASLRSLRRCRAADALSALQQEAERQGVDRLTSAEVDQEIHAVRRCFGK